MTAFLISHRVIKYLFLAKNPMFNNLSILLIESGSKKAWYRELTGPKNGFSNRVSSLNQNTKKFLEKIDIWDIINSRGCRNVTEMKVYSIFITF